MPRTTTLHGPARVAGAALGVLFVFTGCGAKQPRQTAAATPFVQTAVATYGSVKPSNTLAGVVAPFQNVAIQSSLTEAAVTVNVQEGDRVAKGEVLAQLDTSDLQAELSSDLATAASDAASTSHNVYQAGLSIAQGVDSLRGAESALSQAQANLQRDTTDFARDKQLLNNGYISEQQVSQQQTTVRNDEQSVRSAQAQLSSAQSTVNANGSLQSSGLQSSTVQQSRATEQVALAQAQQQRVQIAKATILSPIDGVVVNRNFNPGEYPGTRQLFTLQQVDPIYAILRGSSAQVAAVEPGSVATITTTDAKRSRRIGRVVGVLNQISPGSTDFQVKVQLGNPDDRLRPGTVVEGTITAPPISGMRVPATAFTDDNHTSLLVVNGDSTVKTMHVTELGSDGTTSVVSGLSPEARVVKDGQTSVGDGERVSVR